MDSGSQLKVGTERFGGLQIMEIEMTNSDVKDNLEKEISNIRKLSAIIGDDSVTINTKSGHEISDKLNKQCTSIADNLKKLVKEMS